MPGQERTLDASGKSRAELVSFASGMRGLQNKSRQVSKHGAYLDWVRIGELLRPHTVRVPQGRLAPSRLAYASRLFASHKHRRGRTSPDVATNDQVEHVQSVSTHLTHLPDGAVCHSRGRRTSAVAKMSRGFSSWSTSLQSNISEHPDVKLSCQALPQSESDGGDTNSIRGSCCKHRGMQ